jgi:transcriptional regulator GlxA family with amidase domain
MVGMRLIALLAALLVAAPAFGAEAVALSVEGLARSSDAVVRGQVRRTTATLSADGRRIFTLVDVEVASTWRGQAATTVRVIVPGGIVGGIGQRVDGAPTFAEGEEVVVFLNRAEAGGHRVAGLAQGKFQVAGASATPDLTHLKMVARQVEAGERPAEAMPVAELERRVRSVP